MRQWPDIPSTKISNLPMSTADHDVEEIADFEELACRDKHSFSVQHLLSLTTLHSRMSTGKLQVSSSGKSRMGCNTRPAVCTLLDRCFGKYSAFVVVENSSLTCRLLQC